MVWRNAVAANEHWSTRAPKAISRDQNLRRSLNFVIHTQVSGRRFGVLTMADDFIRECLGLVVDTSLTRTTRGA